MKKKIEFARGGTSENGDLTKHRIRTAMKKSHETPRECLNMPNDETTAQRPSLKGKEG